MSLAVCVYEDNSYGNFFPLTLTRPVSALRAGMFPQYRRVEQYFDNPQVSIACRESLTGTMAAYERDIPVNIVKRGGADLLFLNARIREFGDLPDLVRRALISTRFVDGRDQTVALLLMTEALTSAPTVAEPLVMAEIAAGDRDLATMATTANLYNYAWEMVADLESRLSEEYAFVEHRLTPSVGVRVHEGVNFINEKKIYIGHGCEIKPQVCLDASGGPIYIGDGTVIEPHVAVFGPCFVGPNCRLVAGKISSSSIGHTSRVGGEVEASVFQAYVNKYHAGFIGHSYIGQWVNFGAMTTNSDLKNNYSAIRVMVNDTEINSGSSKVGSFIGDHSKTGIGTLLTTGISIGVSCNLFGGTLVTDKSVPSFSWGETGLYQVYAIDKAIETAVAMARRRNVDLSLAEQSLLRDIFDKELRDKGVLDL